MSKPTRDEIERCPVCKRMTLEEVTDAVGVIRWCIECNITFQVLYNRSLHHWYRSGVKYSDLS